MISGPQYKSLAEAWDHHITAAMNGVQMDADEYHDRHLDYLGGATDILCVLANQLHDRVGHSALTVPDFAITFEQLFKDTNEQLENLVKHIGENNAQSDNVMDDQP